MADVLEARKISKIYSGAVDTQVLYDIDLAFAEGSFNSIIGQSGSGKSTLLNILGTLDRPTSGELIINGRPTTGMRKNELAELRNESIGFIFQFHHLLPEFTARENVLIPYLIRNDKDSEKAGARADELMDMLGLAKVKNNNSTKMSGGQQQRAAIARALMNSPKIILADEPTGNLDSDTSATVYDYFRMINRKFGTTFVIITHDRKIAEQADRIIEIKDGRIHLDLRK
ncbi:MAG: ABC transporter ATP-binding protein [Thermoplasmata archaeon]|nr:ABC transporter ATP-binding protein [Thermoplasmata archaeon]